MALKQKAWRSKNYTDAAADQECVRCWKSDGTIVAAHYTGLHQHQYGKGRSIKCSDIATADLCHDCHTWFDQPTERKSIERSEEFLHCILMTIIRRLDGDFEMTHKQVKEYLNQ